jgi:hypothetical protein
VLYFYKINLLFYKIYLTIYTFRCIIKLSNEVVEDIERGDNMKAMIVKIIIGAAVMWAAIPLIVQGSPVAGCCEVSLPNYENATQRVFENKALWSEPNGRRQCEKSKIQ